MAPMAETLIVLGTGNAMVTRCFNTCFALRFGQEYFLVDSGGGNGILRALADADISPSNIHHVFISHAHTDHILGVPWLVRSIGTQMLSNRYDGTLTIYCHDIAEQAIRTICELTIQKKFTRLFDDRIRFVTLKDGETAQIFGSEVCFFDIRSAKAKQFGMQVSLSNGRRLVCLGDEPCDAQCEQIAAKADWLLCEAFCLYNDRDRFKPYEKHHSTAKDAAELAERLEVKNLVLWHTEDKTLDTRMATYTAEAKTYFGGNVFVPNDLDKIVL
ncbi:MBL fold metallo-hydrolase [Oscillospiraceae bacterium LTW-04]|nr:MBL fold metallo-hydrolase [Oscillospiraceae bacterium MB24-C1]